MQWRQKKQPRKNKLRIAVIGLGNPGPEYVSTRHNAGFLTVDLLSQKLDIKLKRSLFSNYYSGKGVYKGEEISLIKPLTYMNRSGLIIGSITGRRKIPLSNVVVVCDNMDLLPGVVRLKKDGGDAGHNGLKSIISHSGSGEFNRFYIGIGRPSNQEEVKDYVLGVPGKNEYLEFMKGINLAADFILKIVSSSPEQVMNEVNRIKNR